MRGSHSIQHLKMVLWKLKIFEDHRTIVDYYPYCSLVLLSVHMRLIPYICLTNSYNNLINTAMPPFFFLFIVSFISCFIYQRVRNVIFQNISPPSPVFKISQFLGWIKSPIGDFTHKRFESEWVGIGKKAFWVTRVSVSSSSCPPSTHFTRVPLLKISQAAFIFISFGQNCDIFGRKI